MGNIEFARDFFQPGWRAPKKEKTGVPEADKAFKHAGRLTKASIGLAFAEQLTDGDAAAIVAHAPDLKALGLATAVLGTVKFVEAGRAVKKVMDNSLHPEQPETEIPQSTERSGRIKPWLRKISYVSASAVAAYGSYRLGVEQSALVNAGESAALVAAGALYFGKHGQEHDSRKTE